jgi:hypothetical protein
MQLGPEQEITLFASPNGKGGLSVLREGDESGDADQAAD